jgi:hypothetical protein
MHILPQQQSIAWVWFPPSAYGRICAASSTWRTCELVNAHCRLYRSVTITRNAPCPSRGKTVYGRPNRGPATTCSDSTAFRASLQPQIDFRPNSTTSYFVVRKPLPLNCWHRPVRDRNPFLPFEEKVFAGGCSRCCSLRLDRFGYAFSSCTSRFVAAFRFQSPPRSFPQKQPTQNSLGAPCSG